MEPTETTTPDSGAVLETLKQIRASLESLTAPAQNAVHPAITQTAGVTDQATMSPIRQPFLSAAETIAIQKELRQRSEGDIYMMFAEQARKKDQGIPFELWLSMGGRMVQDSFASVHAQMAPEVQKLLDSSSGTAVIRNDLDPFLWELYIRAFPAFERFPKEPANGLVHTFMQLTGFGEAQFMSELGTVTDDKSTYVRQLTNVAILATRRGVTLKSQFAALQGGGGMFNPEQLEMQGGLRAIAAKMQKTIFSGQSTDSGGDADNELGAFDPNGFTGLRSILNTVRAKNVDGTTNGVGIRAAVNAATVEIMQSATTNGPVIAYLSPTVKEFIDEAEDDKVRYTTDRVNVAVGVTANQINTVFGATPLFVVPGDAIGTYGSDEYSGYDVQDIYLVDEATVSLPYLGSPGPTVLDIPIGVSGQLTHLFIIFGMWGLAVKAPTLNNKVRVKVA